MSNSDDIRRLGDELRSDFKFLEVMVRQHFIDNERRFGEVGRHLKIVGEGLKETGARLNETGARLDETGARLDGFGAKLDDLSANSEERWTQLAGRARLMEGRFTTILAAAGREDVLNYCEKLDARLKAVEEHLKLDPPAA